ncbi:hypothetical protein [Clostridium sardiniense]|uniref:hypothetical protein n=1 Tax=Clostridium sardiniense TaxID=29369 RepID=UPI001956E852|nr:hypothetical protein [Clostridium sardiniense]MBM7835749.1 hypothetical protein [Clostridium sardiniense]
MEDLLKRRVNESDFEYKVRLCTLKLDKEIRVSWEELVNILGVNCSPDHLRKLSYAYKEFSNHVGKNVRFAKDEIVNEVKNSEKLIRDEKKELENIIKEKEKYEKELQKLEAKEEKTMKVVETGEYYTIYSSDRQLKVKKDTVKRIKEIYCGQGIGVSQVCRTLNIPRRDFMLIKYAFNIVHDDVPFLDSELEEGNIDNLVNKTLEQKKNEYFIKLQEKEISEMKKELNIYRDKDYLYNKAMEKINKIEIYPSNYNIEIKPYKNKRVALLDLADLHIGIKCDNYFNTYDVAEAYSRAEELTKEVIETAAELGITEIHVSNLGDIISGIIHDSIIKESEILIDDQVAVAVEIIGKMLIEFSQVFDKVIYSDLVGNHGRVYKNKDASTEKENFERFVSLGLGWMFKDRSEYSNVFFEKNLLDNGVIMKEIEGVKIYETHGHLDKFNKMASDLGMMFGRSDEIHTAHYHHNKMEEFHCCEVFMSRSFAGTDTYSKDIRKTSTPGQRLYIYSNGQREYIKDIEF